MRRAVRRKALVGLALLGLLPGPASAWPVDMAVSLESGTDRFHKLTAVEWADVEDPSVATVEVMAGSNELLLTGLKPGRTLVLLYAEGKFGVWRLTVSAPGAKPPPEDTGALLAAARKACPGLEVREGPERALVAAVKDSACRAALMPLLKTDAFLARELELTFELAALQEQLTAVGPALKELGLEARYSGAGVVLTGKASPERHRQALWALFRDAVGRVPLDDRVEVEKPAAVPDAGTPPPAEPPPPPPAPTKPRKGVTPRGG
ncbi:hypothetical protein P2318_06230 [Myxococcaceae bacterium GXIMD 01537]